MVNVIRMLIVIFMCILYCRSTGFTSFPDYLVLHMRKFVMEAGWVPKKLGIFLVALLLLLHTFVSHQGHCVWPFCLFIKYVLPDVYIDVPDVIDISHMRSKGLQPGEELLPEGGMWYFLEFSNSVVDVIDTNTKTPLYVT